MHPLMWYQPYWWRGGGGGGGGGLFVVAQTIDSFTCISAKTHQQSGSPISRSIHRRKKGMRVKLEWLFSREHHSFCLACQSLAALGTGKRSFPNLGRSYHPQEVCAAGWPYYALFALRSDSAWQGSRYVMWSTDHSPRSPLLRTIICQRFYCWGVDCVIREGVDFLERGGDLSISS